MDDTGYRKRIVNYFKKNLAKGYTMESLKWALINQGYPKAIVERAMKQVNEELAKEAPILKDKPKITYQIIDEHNRPITIKKPLWKRILERFFG